MRRLLLLCTLLAATLSARQSAVLAFAPFDQWRAAVLTGNSSALNALYSQAPAPQLTDAKGSPISLTDDLAFWSSLKSNGLTDLSAEIADQKNPQPDLQILVLQLTLTFRPGVTPHQQYIAMAQGWIHQGNNWRLLVLQRSTPARLRQPLENKDIYPSSANPSNEISEALHSAAASHKRILLVFGGNWCFDCHVLDEAFQSPEIAPALNKFFLVVHIDIGHADKNLDIAKKYDIPLDRGVPAIAVLDSAGKLLFSQKRGEFEAARSMAPEDILAFLHHWQPHN
jgi:thioredoxin 1